MTHYRSGTVFERRVKDELERYGHTVVRAAGSKGSSKADLVAFSPHMPVLLVQCKGGKALVSAQEWDRLWEVSQWSVWTIPVIASKDARGRIEMWEIQGPRIPRKPTENRTPYDWRCECHLEDT